MKPGTLLTQSVVLTVNVCASEYFCFLKWIHSLMLVACCMLFNYLIWFSHTAHRHEHVESCKITINSAKRWAKQLNNHLSGLMQLNKIYMHVYNQLYAELYVLACYKRCDTLSGILHYLLTILWTAHSHLAQLPLSRDGAATASVF